MQRCILIAALISLLFSFTNLIPLSSVVCLTIFFFPILVYGKKKIHEMIFALILMFIYFMVHIFLYYPDSFMQYDFYRRDGNVFITYIPLIILSMIRIKMSIRKIVDLFLHFVTSINFIFIVIYLCTGGTVFLYEKGVYHFLFEAHNAAGGYLMILSSLSMGKYLSQKNIKNLILVIVNLLGLYLSDSRGSEIAFLSAMIMYYFYKKSYEKKCIIIFIIFQISLYSFLYLNAPYSFMEESSMTVEGIDSNFIDRGGTIINRGFYLWPRAIQLFLLSPLIGTGFGSYNDIPYKHIDMEYFVYNEASSANVVFSDAHAHNTFLHILAETGIIGLLLLSYFLKKCNTYIKRHPDKQISNGLYIAFWGTIFSSITEHRLFTPSQVLPFIIVLGLSLAAGIEEKEYDNSGAK